MLSNTAVPRYYGAFRDAVIRGDIPVCKEVAMEMYRIDRLIESPSYYYDDRAVEGWIEFCEGELTLTDGSDLFGVSRCLVGTISTTDLFMSRIRMVEAAAMSPSGSSNG